MPSFPARLEGYYKQATKQNTSLLTSQKYIEMGKPAARYSLYDTKCPYCDSDSYHIARHEGSYTALRCLDCNHFYRTDKIFKRIEKIPLLRVSKQSITLNRLLLQELKLEIGDNISVEISKSDGVVIKKDEYGVKIAERDKTTNAREGVFQASDLSVSIREECGILDTSPLNLFTIEKKIMGFILKSNIKGGENFKREIPLSRFLSIRGSGATSISAALRDELNITLGDKIYFYEQNNNLYILNNKKNTDLPIDEGFSCTLQGQKGFSNYFSISSAKFAVYISNKFNVPVGTKFRILCSELKEVDNYKMVQLIKIM